MQSGHKHEDKNKWVDKFHLTIIYCNPVRFACRIFSRDRRADRDIHLFACEAQAEAKLAQVLFDQIQKRVDIFAACEDRAGERSVAAAFTVVDRSVFFDQTAAVGLAV